MGTNRTMGRALSAIVVTSALLGGCGGAAPRRGAETAGAASYQGAVASTDVALGQQVYDEHCLGCHTEDGEGYGPPVAGIGWDPAAMRQQVREGEGRMPAFGEDEISADELEAMLAYLVSIGGVVGSQPAGPAGMQ